MHHHRFHRRAFLNRRGHHAGAYVIADIQLRHAPGKSDDPWVDAGVTIADCHRVVELDFAANTPAERANALFKARLLRDTLIAFTAALESACAEFEA